MDWSNMQGCYALTLTFTVTLRHNAGANAVCDRLALQRHFYLFDGS